MEAWWMSEDRQPDKLCRMNQTPLVASDRNLNWIGSARPQGWLEPGTEKPLRQGHCMVAFCMWKVVPPHSPLPTPGLSTTRYPCDSSHLYRGTSLPDYSSPWLHQTQGLGHPRFQSKLGKGDLFEKTVSVCVSMFSPGKTQLCTRTQGVVRRV